MGDPKCLGWVDSSGNGVVEGWLPKKDAQELKTWRLEWPKKLPARLITPTNTGGELDINDLEVTYKLLAWIVLEGIIGTKYLRYKHVCLFSDNTAAVSWTGGGKKVLSSRKFAQSISFAEKSGKSITITC